MSHQVNKRELADFLRRRREALQPDEVGLPRGGFRRTPGLRREEVAWLAGVSTNYYERLEQARGPRPSPSVLSSLSGALRLSDIEREHLARLAGQAPAVGADPDGAVPTEARRLLDRLDGIPAYLTDPRQDILAWNRLAADLIVDFGRLPETECNEVRLSMRLAGGVCSAPPGREDEFALDLAAELRAARARYPDRSAISELVNEFAAHSPAFAAGWTKHDVRRRAALRKRVRHPDLGELELDRQALVVPGHDLRVVLYTAEPGSLSAAKLAQLAARQRARASRGAGQ